MKKILIILAAVVTLQSCKKDPQSVHPVGNGFQVEFLFEHNGIKMYRFGDNGNLHYFTSQGETISIQREGKRYYDENLK
jgi:hypothetical protein